MAENFHIRMQRKRREEQRQKYAACIAIGFLLLSFLIYFLTMFEPVQKKYLYPYPHQDVVEMYAAKFHVDSTLAASVILNESKFQNDVHSHRGAIGLMQLMPDTAKWISEQIDEPDFSVDQLHDPVTNIRYGVWYLSSLQDEFQGNAILMLAAYNAGRGNVQQWMLEYGWDMDFHDIEQIPYEETRAYVRSVLKNQIRYQELYGKSD